MDDGEVKTSELVGAETAALGPGTQSASGATEQEPDAETDNRSDDSAGNSSDSSSAAGDAGENAGQAGDSEGISESSSSQLQESVSPEDFAAFADVVQIRLDGLMACGAVLVIALWVCIGILTVNEIVTSLRGR